MLKKPYFSGEKKIVRKTLFFKREKKMLKTPIKKKFEKFWSLFSVKNYVLFFQVKKFFGKNEKKKCFWKKMDETRSTTKCLKRKYVI